MSNHTTLAHPPANHFAEPASQGLCDPGDPNDPSSAAAVGSCPAPIARAPNPDRFCRHCVQPAATPGGWWCDRRMLVSFGRREDVKGVSAFVRACFR